jgi:hypothetical protein
MKKLFLIAVFVLVAVVAVTVHLRGPKSVANTPDRNISWRYDGAGAQFAVISLTVFKRAASLIVVGRS